MYPQELKYSKRHVWVETDGLTVRLGITYYAQEQVGKIVYVELPEVGTPVQQDAPFASIESNKTIVDVYSPVTGKVTKVNQSLAESPWIVNEEPYRKGWLIQVNLSSSEELALLLTASQYQELIEKV